MGEEVAQKLDAGQYLYRGHRIILMRPALWRIIGADDKVLSDARSKKLAVEIVDHRLRPKRSGSWPRRFLGTHHGRTDQF